MTITRGEVWDMSLKVHVIFVLMLKKRSWWNIKMKIVSYKTEI